MGQGVSQNGYTLWTNCAFIIGIILISGFAYKTVELHLQKSTMSPVLLPKSLNYFPQVLNDWKGRDEPLDENMARAAGNNDFFNRIYVNEASNTWVNIYFAYCGRPRTMLGHKPETCYVSAGWVHSGTIKSKFYTKLGREVPCLIHRFYMPKPRERELVILNYYIINGKPSNDENAFSGIAWRTPNINGDIAYYVAQVQISSIIESAVISAASDFSETVFSFLPNEQGKVEILQKQARR